MSGPGVMPASLLGTVSEVIYGDDSTAAAFVDESCETFDELWAWNRGLSTLRRAAWQLADAVEKAMMRDLGDEAIRMDDFILRVVPERPSRRIKDEEGLMSYLGMDRSGALLAFRSSDVKVAGVRAWASSRGDDPDEIEDRFFEWIGEEGPPKLVFSRMEYAPHWALRLKHGERMADPKKTPAVAS